MDMLVNKNNTLQSRNEQLERENELLKKDIRLFKKKIELLAYFVQQMNMDYDTLLNNFILDKNDTDKKIYIVLYNEFKKFGVISS